MTFEYIFFVIFGLVVLHLVYQVIKNRGFRGAMFGAPVARTVGEVELGRRGMVRTRLKVHRLEPRDATSPEIGIEFVATAIGSLSMTPLSLRPFPVWPWSHPMSTLSVRLPNSLHRHLRQLAVREGVSMNQLISSAIGEKLAALMTEDYLARAGRGSRKAYDNVLRRVPDVPPEERDRLSNKRYLDSSVKRKVKSAHRRLPRR